jgi:hypothetical protein
MMTDGVTKTNRGTMAKALAWGKRFLFVVTLTLTSISTYAQNPKQLLTEVSTKFDETPVQPQRLKLINSLPTKKAVHLVRINQNALAEHNLAVSLPGTTSFDLTKTGGETSDSKNFTWIGVPRSQDAGGTTLISHNGEITGSIIEF